MKLIEIDLKRRMVVVHARHGDAVMSVRDARALVRESWENLGPGHLIEWLDRHYERNKLRQEYLEGKIRKSRVIVFPGGFGLPHIEIRLPERFQRP